MKNAINSDTLQKNILARLRLALCPAKQDCCSLNGSVVLTLVMRTLLHKAYLVPQERDGLRLRPLSDVGTISTVD